jgi:hypothetical protein
MGIRFTHQGPTDCGCRPRLVSSVSVLQKTRPEKERPQTKKARANGPILNFRRREAAPREVQQESAREQSGMKKIAPVFLAIGAAIITITTAIAGAQGAFRGIASFTPFLFAYGIALLAFVAAALSYIAQDEVPNIAPVRLGKAVTVAHHQLGSWGLFVTNHGDPAYEVHPTGGKVGDSTLIFHRSLQNLSKSDGEGFFPIYIQRADGGTLLGGLFDEMRTKQIDALPIRISYRNGKGHRYKTTCKIARDVTASGGLAIINVRHGRDFFGFLRRENTNA